MPQILKQVVHLTKGRRTSLGTDTSEKNFKTSLITISHIAPHNLRNLFLVDCKLTQCNIFELGSWSNLKRFQTNSLFHTRGLNMAEI